MTDKISNFFKDIRDRLSSPFFSSFIIAWLIINWKIPVALFWYNQIELEKAGYESHFDLIGQLYNPWFFIWLPFISALGYTFLYPFFRNVVTIFNSWIQKWGTDLSIQVSKEGKIPVANYLRLRQNYYKQTQILEDTIKLENSIHVENSDLKNQIALLNNEKLKLSGEVNKWIEKNQIIALNGEWELITDMGQIKVSQRWQFSGGNIKLYDNIAAQGAFTEFQYDDFSYNHLTKMMYLNIHSLNGKEETHFILKDNIGSFEEFTGNMIKYSKVADGGIYTYNIFKVTFRKLLPSNEKITLLAV